VDLTSGSELGDVRMPLSRTRVCRTRDLPVGPEERNRTKRTSSPGSFRRRRLRSDVGLSRATGRAREQVRKSILRTAPSTRRGRNDATSGHKRYVAS
jgi:hypothetical protein